MDNVNQFEGMLEYREEIDAHVGALRMARRELAWAVASQDFTRMASYRTELRLIREHMEALRNKRLVLLDKVIDSNAVTP